MTDGGEFSRKPGACTVVDLFLEDGSCISFQWAHATVEGGRQMKAYLTDLFQVEPSERYYPGSTAELRRETLAGTSIKVADARPPGDPQ